MVKCLWNRQREEIMINCTNCNLPDFTFKHTYFVFPLWNEREYQKGDLSSINLNWILNVSWDFCIEPTLTYGVTYIQTYWTELLCWIHIPSLIFQFDFLRHQDRRLVQLVEQITESKTRHVWEGEITVTSCEGFQVVMLCIPIIYSRWIIKLLHTYWWDLNFAESDSAQLNWIMLVDSAALTLHYRKEGEWGGRDSQKRWV